MSFIEDVVSFCLDLFTVFVKWVVSVVGVLGYGGIIFMMALESSFIPFPSEVVIPPAGYLVSQGEMNMLLVVICGIIGSLIGSSVNYFIAYKYGRKFLERYSKYLFLTPERLKYMDDYFDKHGEITTLIGRLLPVIRQYISFPAGLAKMNFTKFILFTGLGASVWVIILAYIGKMVGSNLDLVNKTLNKLSIYLFPSLLIIVIIYVVFMKCRSSKSRSN